MKCQRAGFFRPVPVIVARTSARRVELTPARQVARLPADHDGAAARANTSRSASESTVRLDSGLAFPALSKARTFRRVSPRR